jgi:hypothetical protein
MFHSVHVLLCGHLWDNESGKILVTLIAASWCAHYGVAASIQSDVPTS